MGDKIVIEGLNLSINENHILQEISCEFEMGRIVVMLGPNGSGKTTFLKTVKGLYRKDSGMFFRDGKEIDYLKDAVMVFDEPILYEELTGKEHIYFIRELSGSLRKTSDNEIEQLVRMLELNGCIEQMISTYSLGMKKKVQFLCALVSKPRILLMDEYISGLDPQVLYLVKKVMKEYVEEGNLIILSTHMLDMAEKFCDDVILLKDGKIRGDGVVMMQDILEEYSGLEKYYLEKMR